MPEYPDCCLHHRTNGPRGSSCGSLAYTGPEATPDRLTRGEAHRKLLAIGMPVERVVHVLNHPGELLNAMRPSLTVAASEEAVAIVAAYKRHCDSKATTDPLATVPAEARARAWDPVGGRLVEPTEGDLIEGATMGAAAPLTEGELRDVEARTSGPGPLAGDGPVMRRLVVEIRASRTSRKAPPLDVRTGRVTDEELVAIERRIANDDAGEMYDTAAAGRRVAEEDRGRLAVEVRVLRAKIEQLTAANNGIRAMHAAEVDALRAELAARPAPAADASLEARAEIAREAWFGGYPHSAKLADLPAEKQETWLAVVRAVDASRPSLTEEQALRWIALLDLDVGPDFSRAWAVQKKVKAALLRASRGEAPPSAAEPVPDSIGPRGSSTPLTHDCGDATCPRHGHTSALGSMAPAVIAEASRADVSAPAAELLREHWIDVGGTAHTSNCSGQLDAAGRCYCGATQPLPSGLTCPGCYAETGIAQPHRETPIRCPGYAAHVTARPEDTSAPTPGPAPACCSRAGEYNGFGSDGPTSFTCPAACGCHD